MNKEKIEQTYKKLFESVHRDDNKEALRINQLIYEDTYMEYEKLLDRKKNSLPDKEMIIVNRSISLCKENLEKMLSNAQRIQELKLSKDKNGTQ